MTRPVRFGFLGAGPRSVGLMQTVQQVPGLKITAICDKYRDLAENAAAKLPDTDVRVDTDHQQMLRDAPIDAVFVVVEPEHAAGLAIEALEAGKHVLSEVPMTFDLDACRALVLAVERSGGLVYQLAEQVRYQPFIQKWRQMVADGTLGSIVHAEGQYLHGMTEDRFWLDLKTGRRLPLAEAADHPGKVKSRLWNMLQPILYLPHELSPLLHAIDDRVVSVLAMSTDPPSQVYDFYPGADLQVALMKTAKGTLLRLSAGFTVLQPRKKITGRHWYNLIGTAGSVETHRADCDQMKLWLPEGSDEHQPQEVMWRFDETNTPPEALASSHGGGDYWPMHHFVRAITENTKPHMDVYQAAETAAPAILAVASIEQDSRLMRVPNFRPGPHRPAGTPFDSTQTVPT